MSSAASAVVVIVGWDTEQVFYRRQLSTSIVVGKPNTLPVQWDVQESEKCVLALYIYVSVYVSIYWNCSI